MSNSIKSVLKKSDFIVNSYIQLRQAYYKYCVSDVTLIKKKFKERVGREVELENPIKFNDKLQWLKLNWYDPLATKCADKYEVREIIEDKIGKEYLNELYGVYESVDEIDLDELPNSFVLKGTHGSGFNIICKDKNNMDWDVEFKKMKRWLRTNYYWQNREWVYKDIKPRIVCEKYMSDSNGEPPNDYKIFCFNGEPKLILVTFDRLTHLTHKYYDPDWNVKDIEITYPNNREVNIPRPEFLDEMLDISRKLSKGFPHVRVDLYCVENKIIFGELTFFHMSGMSQFRPAEFEIEMGNWLKLPKSNKL